MDSQTPNPLDPHIKPSIEPSKESAETLAVVALLQKDDTTSSQVWNAALESDVYGLNKALIKMGLSIEP